VEGSGSSKDKHQGSDRDEGVEIEDDTCTAGDVDHDDDCAEELDEGLEMDEDDGDMP
jgi:hypothetical protein